MNKPSFCVTSMPRSRSAWLAAWLTTDTSICYHDPKPDEVDLLLSASNKRMGFSGPEVCLMFDKYPDVPWLIVIRKTEEALPSFTKIAAQHGIAPDDVQKFWFDRLEYLKNLGGSRSNVIYVEFEYLVREDVMMSVWQHLMPGIPFDAERFHMLNKLIITQDTRKGVV